MKKLPIVFLLTVLLAGPAAAGVVFEVEMTDYGSNHAAAETATMQASVDGRNLKMSITSGAGDSEGDMIFHGDRREMVMVNHDDQSYVVVDEEMLRSIGDQLSGVEAQMREAMKDVPPEQRAMVEQMMKQHMPAQAPTATQSAVVLRNTGERDTKNGYPSVKYEVLNSGRKTQEMWVTAWENIEGGEDAVMAFQEMGEFFREMRESMPSFGRDAGSDNVFEHMKEIDGFPILTFDYAADGSLQGKGSLRSSKRAAVDPAAIEAPAGYQRQTMPGG